MFCKIVKVRIRSSLLHNLQELFIGVRKNAAEVPFNGPFRRKLHSWNSSFDRYLTLRITGNVLFQSLRACSTASSPSYVSSECCDDRKEEVENFRRNHNILIKGSTDHIPIFDIEGTFPEFITNILETRNIKKPTPIQSEAWAVALKGHDLVAISNTGSGKTLGFLLPAIQHINSLGSTHSGPFVLVLVPTRELGQQIEYTARWFSNKNLRCAGTFGGSAKNKQLQLLSRGVEIVIATPGRLIDLLQMGCLNLSECTFVVLDEADRMLDMGFLPQIEKIFEYTQKRKQVLLWSATWPKEVKEIARKFLDNYIFLAVGPYELTANPNITQLVKICRVEDKRTVLLETLQEIFSSESKAKVLVFSQTKFDVSNLCSFLRKNSRYPVNDIHGDKSQKYRNDALAYFRRGFTKILVATEVAARGLDVTDITHIVNFDAPLDECAYVHKIGRTARYNSKGTAITFLTPSDVSAAKFISKIMKECNQDIPEELKNLVDQAAIDKSTANRFGGRDGRKSGFWNNKFKRRRYY